MNDEPKLEKATLVALDEAGKKPDDSTRVEVQFNPESLKLSFANQISQPQGGGNQTGTDGQQFVGAGSTKLALQLWFDATLANGAAGPVSDVRELTGKVARFMAVKPSQRDPKMFVPPKVRFVWGGFEFEGIMESLEESLEFFSSDGRALRANLAVSLSQQKIAPFKGSNNKNAPASSPGEQPLAAAPQGSSVQQMAALSGKDWKLVAAANNIENPRLLATGTRLNLNAKLSSRLL